VSLAWHFDACCVTLAALSGGAYAAGVARLWRRAGIGRGAQPLDVALYAAGWLAASAASLSPLHALGTRVFSVHMVEHELLMVIAAPLLVLARPLPVLLWSLPLGWRVQARRLTGSAGARALWRWLTDPVHAALLHAAALWLWHLPAPFESALANEWMHAAQHICFLATALLFWWSVLSREARRRGPGLAALLLFATAIHTSLLGALLTFAQNAWYPAAPDPFAICGLTRIEDQQLAGLVMWVPASLAYLAALLWLIGRWLVADGKHGEGHAAATGA
jgi:putative membrane protein